MREIEWSTNIKKDYRQIETNPRYAPNLGVILEEIIGLLVLDKPLPIRCRDHALSGNWKNHRECHVKPDLLLIYQKRGKDLLYLVRLGSHSELFG